MVHCFHIYMENFACFEDLVWKLGQDLPHFQALTDLRKSDATLQSCISVCCGLNWSRNHSMKVLLSGLKWVLARCWILRLVCSEHAPKHRVPRERGVTPIQLGSFGSDSLEPSDLFLGFGDGSVLHNLRVHLAVFVFPSCSLPAASPPLLRNWMEELF